MADKKTMTDVEKPGTTPAPATSRPIIISKTPAIKDPMVSEEPESKTEPVRLAPPSAVKKTIAPLSAAEKEPKASKPTSVPDTQAVQTETQEDIVAPELPTDQSAEEIAAAKQAAVSKEEQEQAQLIEKLVEQKKYFVPIDAARKRQTARNTMLLFLFLVVLAGVVLAIDANVIQTNIILPFDLIKTTS